MKTVDIEDDRTMIEMIRFVQTTVLARVVGRKFREMSHEPICRTIRDVHITRSDFRKRLIESNRTVAGTQLRHSTDAKFIHRRIRALIENGYLEEVPGKRGRGSCYRLTRKMSTYLSMAVRLLDKGEITSLARGSRLLLVGSDDGKLVLETKKGLRKKMTSFLEKPDKGKKQDIIFLMDIYLGHHETGKRRKRR